MITEPRPELPAPGGEDLVEQIVAADRGDRVDEPEGESAVVRGEEVLGIGRNVVLVARPAHAVALGLVRDQARLLQCMELLEHTRPAGAKMGCEAIRRHRPTLPKVHEDGPAERGWRGNRRRRAVAGGMAEAGDRDGLGELLAGGRDGLRHAERLAQSANVRLRRGSADANLGPWILTFRPSTSSCGRPSATSWSMRLPRSSTSTSASGGSPSRSSNASARWAGWASRFPRTKGARASTPSPTRSRWGRAAVCGRPSE